MIVAIVVVSSGISDPKPAYAIMDRLGVLIPGSRPTLQHYNEDQKPYFHKNFTFAEKSVSLRADNSLFAYWWSPNKEVALQRRNQPQVIPDSEILASAKRYVARAWPDASFVFKAPYQGADSEAPSRMVEFRAVLGDYEVDETHLGLVELDSIGGELRMIRSPDTPLPPASTERRIEPENAQALMLTHIVSKYRPQTLWIALPSNVRIFSGQRDAYHKPSRLVYRIDVYEVVSNQPNGLPSFGRWIRCKIDANSGEILVDLAAGLGSKVAFDRQVPGIPKHRFGTLCWGKGNWIAVNGGSIRKVIALAKEPKMKGTIPLVLIGGEFAIAPIFDPTTAKLNLKYAAGWYEAEPDTQLAKALRKMR